MYTSSILNGFSYYQLFFLIDRLWNHWSFYIICRIFPLYPTMNGINFTQNNYLFHVHKVFCFWITSIYSFMEDIRWVEPVHPNMIRNDRWDYLQFWKWFLLVIVDSIYVVLVHRIQEWVNLRFYSTFLNYQPIIRRIKKLY